MRARAQDIHRYSEVVEDYARIHAGRHDGLDMTLCGAALEGAEGSHEMLPTRRRITCPQCLGIIEYCKSIPRRLVERDAQGV